MPFLKIIFPVTVFFFIFTSCKKNDSPKGPVILDSAAIFGFKDSTLLIKSISQITYDSASGTIGDSATEYFYYDTVNKKIIISLQQISNASQPYDGEELQYNSAGLISTITDHFTTAPADSNNFSSSNYLYDAANVIKSASVKLLNGFSYTISFTKSPSASGYTLNWTDISPNSYPDSISYLADFDNNGKLMAFTGTYTDQFFYTDSLIYDATGNINKVVYHDYDPVTPDSSLNFVWYDFTLRDTKGDQLYNLNQVLYNGIANLPNSITDGFTGNGNIDEDVYQYTKFPALKTTIRKQDFSGSDYYIVNFNSTPQYDSKNRLVKYTMFFNDVNVNNSDYTISYYK